MALIAKEGSSFEPAPEGVFPARCIWVIDLGTQVSDGMFGHSEKHQMYLNWELVDETTSSGLPLTIGAFFTVSLNPKGNLRPTLERWRGRAFTPEELKGFDVAKLINAPCQISIKHQPKADGSGIRAQVSGVMAPVKGMVVGAAREKTILFDLDDPTAKTKLAELPDWLKSKVTSTAEWQKIMGFEAAAPTPAPQNTLNNAYAAMKNGTIPTPKPVTAGEGFDDEIPF